MCEHLLSKLYRRVRYINTCFPRISIRNLEYQRAQLTFPAFNVSLLRTSEGMSAMWLVWMPAGAQQADFQGSDGQPLNENICRISWRASVS